MLWQILTQRLNLILFYAINVLPMLYDHDNTVPLVTIEFCIWICIYAYGTISRSLSVLLLEIFFLE